MIGVVGGRVLTRHGWAMTDLVIEGERIAGLGEGRGAPVVIDASGCLVGPGFVDLHTHLREPGQTWKEDIASGAAAAAAGGFTAVVAMPNTDPPIDTAKIVTEVVDKGKAVGLTEVVAAAALTVDRGGAVPVDVRNLHQAGVRIFTDDGDSVADPEVLRDVMAAVAELPYGVVAQHAEDGERTSQGHMHEGELSRRLGIGGLASSAESDVVARDLELVAATGVRYHCQHVSAKETVELVREAKRRGLAVTAEVTPHHLSFDEADVAGLDTNFKMYPPLRGRVDRLALIAALRDGTIDVVATDHAPHSPREKDVEFASAPRGVIGLETAASAVWEAVHDEDRLFDVLSRLPAEIAGLGGQGLPLEVGGPANLVVFDPYSTWVPTRFASKSSNSPYRGREMAGVVRATVYEGRVVHQTGAVAA
jgi:dihydroorotase